jgi:uncharacterized repeat protein (TIGR03803 family)
MSAAALLLAGCDAPGGLAQGRTLQPALAEPSRGYRLLFNFQGAQGEDPLGFTAQNGVLYGTTSGGGANGAGTFFSLTTSGNEHVLHSFKSDYEPTSALTPLNGLLYGMSCWPCGESGSGSFRGLIFSLSTSGRERILHRFEAEHLGKGIEPDALTVLNGMLYGTTRRGGSQTGTVFSLSPSGHFHVLYRFSGGYSGPRASRPTGIVALDGVLYGTTDYGGTTGNGTVFRLTTAGKYHVLYSFKGHGDGALPNGLIVLHGKLYGTTLSGGSYYACAGNPPAGCGTIFSVTTAGEERVLYSFQGQSDGENPMSNLTALNGKLYGTTINGTLFSITTTGTEKTLLSLSGCNFINDAPCSVLTALNGTLYGTTPSGGSYYAGTAYAFTP